MNPQDSIAHYRIGAKLGEGGVGAVYRAADSKLNRDLAVRSGRNDWPIVDLLIYEARSCPVGRQAGT